MTQFSSHDRDYAFGRAMLTLRTTVGLTQAALAEYLGVSRRAVGDWEAGNSYPKAEHLKSFIGLAVEYGAFQAGREADDIRAFWKAARQKVMLDEVWLTNLLSNGPLPASIASPPDPAHPIATPATAPRVDWGDALAVPTFYGREWELGELAQWVVEERCRIVGVLGLGGIGKSALSVRLMHQVAERFDVVIWRSLRDAPACEALLDECLQVLAPEPSGRMLTDFEQRLNLLLDTLRGQRALVVLDNMEAVLEDGEATGQMRPGYEGYERLLRRVGETGHQSCLLFTSREKPTSLIPLEGSQLPVRVLRLARLESKPCEQLLAEKGIVGTDSEQAWLIDTYAGNPLALKIVAQTIVDLFDGEITPFLNQGEIIFGSVRDLLAEQFVRLSALEQSVLLWLAIMREPSTLDEVLALLVTPVSRGRLLEALDALFRRSLIERGQKKGSFTLQSVVLEYATARFIGRSIDEIQAGKLARLIEHGLELAHAREYVRQTQERLIAVPILAGLRSMYLQKGEVEKQLRTPLAHLTTLTDNAQGYGPANLVTLLRLQQGHLRGLDLSRLLLRGAYLQGVNMQDSRMVSATLQDCLFTETFDAMTSVAISRTGEYWAASSRRGELRIWEAGGRLLRHAWRGHADMVWGIVFSPDGRLLASGGWDGMVKVWDVASSRLLWSGKHTSHVNRVAFTPDGRVLATAGNDAIVQLWDVASGTVLQTLPHLSPVAMVIWSPDGHLLASGDVDGCVRLWTMLLTDNSPTVQMLTEHQDYVDGMSFAPDGHTLASASWDGTIKLWEVASGRLLHTLAGHIDRAARVTWSPDGRTIASSGFDQTILLWDVEQASYRAVLRGHTSGVYELAFTPDSRNLLSGSRDGTLRVWDVVTEQCVRVIQGYSHTIYDVDWSPDGTRLVSGASDLMITLWGVADKTSSPIPYEHIGVVIGVGWSPNGRWLASSETEHAIRLWDLTSGAEVRFLRQADRGGNYAYGVAWSSDGNHVASGTHRCGVMIWDALTGEQTWVGRQSATWFPHIAWNPDGKHLAGGGTDGIVYIWGAMDDPQEQQLVGHRSLIKSLAWSPDGTLLASGAGGNEEGDLFVWDVQRGEVQQTFVGHSSIILALAWDATGTVLISGGDDGMVRWWDVQSGVCMAAHAAHQGTVQALRRSPDGATLASCGDDGAIKLWDLRTGEYLQTLRHDRPYERLNITGIRGLTEAQKATLRALGAIEDTAPRSHPAR